MTVAKTLPLAATTDLCPANLNGARQLFDSLNVVSRALHIRYDEETGHGTRLDSQTAWTAQVRDPSVRAALLTTSLARVRKETPTQFLQLIGEWLHPGRMRTWPNGIQALLPMIEDPAFQNLPPVLDVVEPIIEAAPPLIQLDLEELILALYKASPNETSFFLRQVISASKDPMTVTTLKRISSSFPMELQNELRDLLRKQTTAPRKGG